MDQTKHYIFYDGDCGFCNYWVYWILKNDTKDQFRFASLQSDFGQKFLKERGLKISNFESIILWKPNEYYLTESEAIFKICTVMGGKYAFLGYSKFLPSYLSNSIYRFIAKRRHQLNHNNCPLPTTEERKKFVS